MIVLEAAYHGNTTTLVDISPYKFNGPGGEGAPPWVHGARAGRVSRRLSREDAGRDEYAATVAEAVESLRASSVGVGGVHRRERAERRRTDHPARRLSRGTSTRSSARPAASASPTKCRPAFGRMGTHF